MAHLEGALEGGVSRGDGGVVPGAYMQLAIVLQQQRPLAGVKGGGSLLGLDDVCKGTEGGSTARPCTGWTGQEASLPVPEKKPATEVRVAQKRREANSRGDFRYWCRIQAVRDSMDRADELCASLETKAEHARPISLLSLGAMCYVGDAPTRCEVEG